MREGWEYKKLGEVAQVVSGATPKTNVEEYWGEGHYWVTPAELNDTTVVIYDTERQITDKALEKIKLQLLPKGTVLLSSRAPIGKVAICGVDMYCNQGFKNCICSDAIYNKFLFYFLKDRKGYLNSLGRGATFKEISKSIVEKVEIPLPPMSVQLEIVSELDQINELIRLKKEQLKDYDKLAQSIFYEMFGDPVENGKGWEVKRFSEVFNVTSSKRIYLQELVNEGVPFLKVSDIVSMVDGKEAVPKSFIKESLFDDLQSRGLVPRKGDLLITARGTLGKCYIMKETDRFYFQDGMVTWLQKKVELESLFVKYVFCDNSFRVYLNRNAKHTTVDYISIQHLGNMKIPLPPLPLQQEFSSRISQIERQKAEVSNAIADLETLLASRMQYWFE